MLLTMAACKSLIASGVATGSLLGQRKAVLQFADRQRHKVCATSFARTVVILLSGAGTAVVAYTEPSGKSERTN